LAAAGVGDGSEDELEVFAVEAREVAAEVYERPAEKRRGDSEQASFAAGRRAVVIFGHLLDVDPPPARVAALLGPRVGWSWRTDSRRPA